MGSPYQVREGFGKECTLSSSVRANLTKVSLTKFNVHSFSQHLLSNYYMLS